MFDLIPPMLLAAILNRTSDDQDDHADREAVLSLGATCSHMKATIGGIMDVILVADPRAERRRFVESLREGDWRRTLDHPHNQYVLHYMAIEDVPPLLEGVVDPVETLVDAHSRIQPSIFTVCVNDDRWYEARSEGATARFLGTHTRRIAAWRGLAVGSLLIHGADRLQWVRVVVGGQRLLRVTGVALRTFTRSDGVIELMGFLRHLAIMEWQTILLEADSDFEVTIKLRKQINEKNNLVWAVYQVGEEFCHLIDGSETCAIRVCWNMVGLGILCVIQDEEGVWCTDCVATFAIQSLWLQSHSYELPGWAAVGGPLRQNSKGLRMEVAQGLTIQAPRCYYLPVDDTINFGRCDDVEIIIRWKKVPRGGTVRIAAITRNWISCLGGMAGVAFMGP